MPSLQFTGGLNRNRNAPAQEPYALKNAILERAGVVRALEQPTADQASYMGDPPFYAWNGGAIASGSASHVEASRTIASADQHGGSLYASSFVGGTDPRLLIYRQDYDPADHAGSVSAGLVVSEVPRIVSSTPLINTEQTVGGTTGISHSHSKGYHGYIIIPFSLRNEAGVWFYYHSAITLEYMGTEEDQAPYICKLLQLAFEVSAETDYVEVYRTPTMSDKGYCDSSLFAVNDDAILDDDLGFYFLGRFQAEVVSSTRRVYFEDNRTWMTPRIYARLIEGGVITENEYPLTVSSGTGSASLGLADTPVLERKMNLHADTSSVPRVYKGVAAKVMYNHAGVMLYGNVTWHTKTPGVVLYKTTGGGQDIILRTFYKSPEGDEHYGEPVTYVNTEALKVRWRGEAGLLVINAGTGQVIERLSPDPLGFYVSRFRDNSGDSNKYALTYHKDLQLQGTPATPTFDTSNTGYLTERNVVLLAEQDRPLEITHDQFVTADDSEVRAIFGASMEEAESLRAFDFMVATDRGIAAYEREGGSVYERHVITSDFGVKHFDGYTNALPTPVIATIPGGVALVGTNNRPYILSGRRLVDLALSVPGLFEGTGNNVLRSLSYDPIREWIWAIKYPGSIYIFDLDVGRWIGVYEEDFGTGSGWYDSLWFDPNRGCVVANVYTDEIETPPLSSLWIYEDVAARYTDAFVVTQPLAGSGVETSIRVMEIDYDAPSYDRHDSNTHAVVKHSIRSSVVEQWDEAGTGKVKSEYRIPANARTYPMLRGRGHQFKVTGFTELRDIELSITPDNSLTA